MINYKLMDTKGNESGNIELNENVFNQPYNEALIHQVVVAQLANKRQGTKCSLTRAEVRGGGAKPWRQKGTGRARQGSIRSPQWYHGGVVFAPKPRDFSKKINVKMKSAAFCSAISQKLRDGNVIILNELEISEPKTKLMAEILKNIGVEKTALMVMQDNKNVLRAGRNIEGISMINVNTINVYDILRFQKLVLTAEAVKSITEVYA